VSATQDLHSKAAPWAELPVEIARAYKTFEKSIAACVSQCIGLDGQTASSDYSQICAIVIKTEVGADCTLQKKKTIRVCEICYLLQFQGMLLLANLKARLAAQGE